MFINILVVLFAIFFFLIGTIGMPGNSLILAMTLLYGVLDGFVHVDAQIVAFSALVYLLGEVWEVGISFLGVRKEKVAWSTVIGVGFGAFFAGFVGSFVFPIIGSIIGASAGAFAAAYLLEIGKGSKYRAIKIAKIAAASQIVALLGRFVVGIILVLILIFNLGW